MHVRLTEVGADTEATGTGAAVMERLSLPRVVRTPAAAFQADSLTVTSFTAASFMRAFAGFFLGPVAALEGIRKSEKMGDG